MFDTTNKERIWSLILANLQPPAARALVSQYCSLIKFDGSVAYIGISSLPLLKLAQEKVPNIEVAFEAVCKTPVTVRLHFQAQSKDVDLQSPTEESVLFRLGIQAISRTVNNLSSSTRAMVKASQIAFSHNGMSWHIVIAAPSEKVLKRMLKRTESITKTFEKTFSKFILSFCLKSNLVPFFGDISGRVERKILVNDLSFAQLKDSKNKNWIHVVHGTLVTREKPVHYEDKFQYDEDGDILF